MTKNGQSIFFSFAYFKLDFTDTFFILMTYGFTFSRHKFFNYFINFNCKIYIIIYYTRYSSFKDFKWDCKNSDIIYLLLLFNDI